MMDRRKVLTFGGLGVLASLGGRALALPAAGPVVSKIMLEDRRLWIAAAIGKSKPYLFVIDTGAGFAYIRPEIAKALGLQATGNTILGGLGKKQVLAKTYVAHDVVFGGAIRQPTLGFAAYDFERGLPADAAGLFASGLITTRDSDLDFDAGEWRVWPAGRPDRTGFEELDAGFGEDGVDVERYTRRPVANAMLNGRRYRFLLDTGAPRELLLLPEAARQCGLFDDTVPFAPQRTNGFGGAAAKLSRVVRARDFQFGPLSLHRPLVTVMDPDQKDGRDHDGVIGLPLISLLNLSTDVRRRRLWGQRNRRAETPQTYPLAGIWLDKQESGQVVVTEVGTGSPAFAAGIRAGDIVSDPPSFADAIRRIAGGPGHKVRLGLQREGKPVNAEYTLAPYL